MAKEDKNNKDSLVEFLQKENKELQKQFLKAKSELYEAKYKNQSLKGKIEKMSQQNT